MAGVVSLFASANPDGLEFVGEQVGFTQAAADSAVAGSPLADYGVAVVSNPLLSGALAGVVGVLVTVVLALALAALARRGNARRPESTSV